MAWHGSCIAMTADVDQLSVVRHSWLGLKKTSDQSCCFAPPWALKLGGPGLPNTITMKVALEGQDLDCDGRGITVTVAWGLDEPAVVNIASLGPITCGVCGAGFAEN